MKCSDLTVMVVRKNGMYLSRREMLTGRIVWDRHLGSAWRTKVKRNAVEVARKFGGEVMLFNPATMEVRAL